jgi:hypothetical protein
VRPGVPGAAGNLGECDAFATATLEDGPSNFLARIRDVLVKAEKNIASQYVRGRNI